MPALVPQPMPMETCPFCSAARGIGGYRLAELTNLLGQTGGGIPTEPSSGRFDISARGA